MIGRGIIASFLLPLLACTATAHLEVSSPAASECVDRCQREAKPSATGELRWASCAEECAGVVHRRGQCPQDLRGRCVEIEEVLLGRSLLLAGGIIAGAVAALYVVALASYGE